PGRTCPRRTANAANGRDGPSGGGRSTTADQAASTVPPSGRSTSSRSRPAASRYRAKRRTPTRTVKLEAVGLTAAAARLHVRVLDREAGTHHVVVDEVDLTAGQIRRAVLIDVHLDAVAGLDDVVTGRLLVLPPQLVRHTGAAATDHADPEAPLGLALFQAELRHLLRCGFRQRDHSGLPFGQLTICV